MYTLLLLPAFAISAAAWVLIASWLGPLAIVVWLALGFGIHILLSRISPAPQDDL